MFLCDILPTEVLLIIWENFMTTRDKVFITKKYYEENHKHIFEYYPKLRNKKIFANYCFLLAKNNCYYVLSLLLKDNYSEFYSSPDLNQIPNANPNPRSDIRLYYNDHVYWSYLTYMRDIAKINKCNETYTLLAIDVKNKRKEEERKKGTKKEREKKNFKTKKYIREWGN